MSYLFENRKDAGEKLYRYLKSFEFHNPLILALPRGGVVVAAEVAQDMKVPMDIVVSRKIGAPGQPEYGIGALSEDEVPHFNPEVSNYFNPRQPAIQRTVREEVEELHRRIELYRHGVELPDMTGRTVIVVDDGLATGVTAVAAAKFLRSKNPKELILAVPVGPKRIPSDIEKSYDRVICLYALENMMGVGLWYNQFEQTEDQEVLDILKKFH